MDGGLHRPNGEVSGTESKFKRICCTSEREYTGRAIGIPNVNTLDALLESFLDFSDSSAVAFDLSLGRILESKFCDFEKDDVIQRANRLGSTLIEVSRRSKVKQASKHNANIWVLPAELTVKVFSMLDTKSVCHAAAACSFFRNCAGDPVCYSNIDFISIGPNVNNLTVSTMIERAGKSLRSIKLGVHHRLGRSLSSGSSQDDERSTQLKELSVSCLAPLNGINGHAPGALLRRLHLHNIQRMDNAALDAALSACPSLLDLEIIRLFVHLDPTFQSVSKSCHLVERLHFESGKTGRDDFLTLATCVDLVENCPNMSSLALIRFNLPDRKVCVLVKGFHRLTYLDLSGCCLFTGKFLNNLGGISIGSLLEFINLRDCLLLKEREVSRFLDAILSGCFKHLKLLDISNQQGLAIGTYWRHRSCTPCVDSLAEIMESRPNLCVSANFPAVENIVDPMIISSDMDASDDSDSSGSSFYSEDSSTSSDGIDGLEFDLNENPDVHYWEISHEIDY